MFNSKNFAQIKELVKQISTLISEHNKLSYKKLSFQTTSISYEFIRPKDHTHGTDPLSKDVMSFYENYSEVAYAIHDIENLLKEISYTPDDLAMKIDLSTDSIIDLAAKLMLQHDKILTAIQELKALTNRFANEFVDHLKLNNPKDITDFIKVIFICMRQEGLHKKLNINEKLRPFILIGSKLISVITYLLSDEDKQLIETEMIRCKQVIFGINTTPQSLKVNKLQTFGLVPDEGSLQPLHLILNDVFGFDIKEDTSIEREYDSLEKILKLSVADTGLSTGLIVFVSTNEDVFFDMTPLYSINKSLGSRGIDEEMINKLNLIKLGGKSKAKQNDMILINVNKDTELAYLLWTNNYITFKSRRKPITKNTINKLIRLTPSPIIESYNQLFENMIQANRLNDAIMFNKVKYMTFTKERGEEEFLNELVDELVVVIHTYLEKNGVKSIADDVFSESLFDTLDQAKSKFGISNIDLPSHCHIIYGNVATKIVGKLKKELLSSKSFDKNAIVDIVKLVVCSNDNIYSRTIASYYLHIA